MQDRTERQFGQVFRVSLVLRRLHALLVLSAFDLVVRRLVWQEWRQHRATAAASYPD